MIWVFQNASWVKCRNLTAEVLSLPAWKWTSGFLVNVYNLIRPTPLCLWLKIIVYEEKNPRTLRVWKLCAPEPQKVFNKFGWCCCRTDDGLARIPLYRKMDDFQFLQPAVTLVQISFTVDFFSAFTCVRSAMHITLCKRTAWITVSMRCSFFVKHCIFTYWFFYFIRFHTYTFSELTTNKDKYKKKFRILTTFLKTIIDYFRAAGTISHVFLTIANRFVTHWKCLNLI